MEGGCCCCRMRFCRKEISAASSSGSSCSTACSTPLAGSDTAGSTLERPKTLSCSGDSVESRPARFSAGVADEEPAAAASFVDSAAALAARCCCRLALPTSMLVFFACTCFSAALLMRSCSASCCSSLNLRFCSVLSARRSAAACCAALVGAKRQHSYNQTPATLTRYDDVPWRRFSACSTNAACVLPPQCGRYKSTLAKSLLIPVSL